MKRVLIFSTNYLPFIGGAEIAVREITDRIADLEFSMLVPKISRTSPRKETLGKVSVHRIGFGYPIDKFIFPLLGLIAALWIDRRRRFSLSWSIMASQASIAAVFFRMLRPSVPLVLTLQEGDEEEHLARYVLGSRLLYRMLIRPWHALVFRKADCVTAISSYLKDRAASMGVHASVDIVPNGVDLSRFVPESPYSSLEQRAHIRTQLGAAESDTLLVTTSRLVEKNGVEDIVRALKSLPESVFLVVIGSGKLLERLKSVADELHLLGRIRFVGELPQRDIPAYLHASDIFVRPSLSEGFGNSFVEAMAAGLPVVATPVGGIVDFLEDGVTGLFAKPGNPASVAKAISRLLADTDLAAKVRVNAFAMVKERYDWATVAAAMRRSFARCLER
jgi:glycosyltransferase involved in cell wall biosynthesis